MTTSVVLGAIFVLIAAAQLGATYYFRASAQKAGGGLLIGAIVTLSLGALFLIQHAKPLFGIVVVLIAQVIAIASLVQLLRDEANNRDSEGVATLEYPAAGPQQPIPPRQPTAPTSQPRGLPQHHHQQNPPPGTYGTPR